MNKEIQHNEDLKPLLIDLEASNIATGGKQENISVQPERLSGEDNMYVVYWIKYPTEKSNQNGYIGITKNLKERIKAHKKNKKKTILTSIIKKHGWDNLTLQVLYTNLTLEEALLRERELRPIENIGWNLQRGGEIGVLDTWYSYENNRSSHSLATSIGTKQGIMLKDTTEKRSKRAKESRKFNHKSYEGTNKGSKNPKAKLTEKQVYSIKVSLLRKEKSIKELAKLYNVKEYVIQFIKAGKTWKHVICDSPDYK